MLGKNMDVVYLCVYVDVGVFVILLFSLGHMLSGLQRQCWNVLARLPPCGVESKLFHF